MPRYFTSGFYKSTDHRPTDHKPTHQPNNHRNLPTRLYLKDLTRERCRFYRIQTQLGK